MPLPEAFYSTGLVHFYSAERHNFTPQLTQMMNILTDLVAARGLWQPIFAREGLKAVSEQ
jgi:hypothetical protein